jgi:Ca-activated chloride channel family protein
MPGTRWNARLVTSLLFVLAVGAWLHAQAGEGAKDDGSSLNVEITSPLGRTGMAGPVRIVARISADPKASLSPVQFFVDEQLVGEDKDGPPYAVEWVDSNPFLPRSIVVQVADSMGGTAKDTIDLKPQELVDSTEVSSVVLEPMVFNKLGRPVNGLTVQDFSVLENDVPQTIDMAVPDTVPATYTLLIDSSGSMARRIDFVRDAAGRLPTHLRPNDSVIVVPFARGLGTITGPTQDRDTIAGAIGAIKMTGGTAILESLTKVTHQLSIDDGRNIVVLITDGYDEDSDIPFDQALDKIKSAKSTVYVIGIAGVAGISIKGEDLLRKLAQETGGRAFFPSRDTQLADVHKLIAEDVQQRYVLSYNPTNRKRDGTWRTIKLMPSNPEYTVRVRPGYRAPAPAPIRPQIELTIRDLSRRLIDVTPADLQVMEDGAPQKIEAFQEALSPVSIVLALDESGSMRQEVDAVVAAARSFVLALPEKDKLALMMFSDKTQMVHDLTTNRETSMKAVGNYRATGGTALYDAVYDSIARLKRAEGRTALIVMTDGKDENNPGTAPGSVHTLDQVLSSLEGLETTIYAIGLGEGADRPTLERLAEASKGEAYFPADVTALEGEYKRILENLRRRYVLTYTSTNTARDGSWRKVEIQPTRPGLSVETRGGYFAPEDP